MHEILCLSVLTTVPLVPESMMWGKHLDQIAATPYSSTWRGRLEVLAGQFVRHFAAYGNERGDLSYFDSLTFWEQNRASLGNPSGVTQSGHSAAARF